VRRAAVLELTSDVSAVAFGTLIHESSVLPVVERTKQKEVGEVDLSPAPVHPPTHEAGSCSRGAQGDGAPLQSRSSGTSYIVHVVCPAVSGGLVVEGEAGSHVWCE
jgi:hypothetical protein